MVRSTRFEDLPLGDALAMQSRRFGVGYVETLTRFPDVTVRHRVLAPDLGARALVSEVELITPDGAPRRFSVIEVWDPNFFQVEVELLTSDLASNSITARIDRRRRARAADFLHRVSFVPGERRIEVVTTARALPSDIDDRLDPATTDWFLPELYLARLDPGPIDGVWLVAEELWGAGVDRAPPSSVSGSSSLEARTLEVPGEGQPVALAMRAELEASGTPVRMRHAFGMVPAGDTAAAAIAELRAVEGELPRDTAARWHDRLLWAAFPGLPSAGALQRELAWSSYGTLRVRATPPSARPREDSPRSARATWRSRRSCWRNAT